MTLSKAYVVEDIYFVKLAYKLLDSILYWFPPESRGFRQPVPIHRVHIQITLLYTYL